MSKKLKPLALPDNEIEELRTQYKQEREGEPNEQETETPDIA